MSSMVIKPANQRARIYIVRLLAFMVVASIPFVAPILTHDSVLLEFMEFLGLILIVSCILGRLWCLLYVGNLKNKELVQVGPYSMTRNPLYFFSTIGAIGIGLVFEMATLGLVLGGLTYLIFRVTAAKEESFLRSKFPESYPAYASRVPSFLPNPMLYQETDQPEFSPQALRNGFLDVLPFLSVFLLSEGMEIVREATLFPVLFHLF